MWIKEIRERCKVTKKALDYYESKGLICPKLLDNGYRDYSEHDAAVIKEITVLRQCGINISDIKIILGSSNKTAALEKCKYPADLQVEKMSAVRDCLAHLMQDYNVEREFAYLQEHTETVFSIKEQLVLAFPGNYGLFLALHFGRFLNGPIDTEQKRTAYMEIVRYLDSVSLFIDPELQEFMQALFTVSEKINTSALERQAHEQMTDMLGNTEGYFEQHKEDIEEYINYKLSDEFKNSIAGRLQQKMIEFQKNSGYQERFIKNLKILSSEYADYLEQLEEANEKLFKRFPKAKELYGD